MGCLFYGLASTVHSFFKAISTRLQGNALKDLCRFLRV